ncbi:MAG: DNA topoisomerase IB [Actinomycetota bacterium]
MANRRKRTVAPEAAAREAGLVYVDDREPGIGRARSGRGFRYTTPDGKTIRDAKVIARIKALAVPPAWKDVWICSSPRGHIQATGRDARGRKQYRYHSLWRETRDRTKYDRIVPFGEALPAIRKRVREGLSLQGLPREKVLAAVVRLLDVSYLRIGGARYAKENGSFGLTTMRDRHAEVSGGTIRFEFVGKGGKRRTVDVSDPRIARIVKRCQDIPGQQLFQYLEEDGTRRPIASDDVNAYLREISGEDFTAKDFRTWAGTVLALRALAPMEAGESDAQTRRSVNEAVEVVAGELGNTVAVCRACYVHPAVIEAYADGSLANLRIGRVRTKGLASSDRLRPHEAALLRLLRGPAARRRAA